MTKEEAAQIADCAKCPFAKDGLPPHAPVLAEIPKEPVALMIGEGPGDEEIQQRKPFVGQTGQQLDYILAREGIARSKLLIANAMACKPPPGKTDSMLRAASKACHNLFTKQVERYRSLPTLTMGKWATWAILGKAIKTEQTRGFIRDSNLITTWHPTYAFWRNPWVRGDFEVDIARFKRLIDGRLQKNPRVQIKPNRFSILRLLRSIQRNRNTVAVDIETAPEKGSSPTTGKDPTRARLKTIGLGTQDYALAIKFEGADREVWSAITDILLDSTVTKVFHNGWFFDLRVLARYGIDVVNIRDTREIRRALVATSGLSLRYLAQTYCDFIPWKEAEDEK